MLVWGGGVKQGLPEVTVEPKFREVGCRWWGGRATGAEEDISCRGPGAAKVQHLKHKKQTQGWQGSILRAKGATEAC